MALQKFDEVNDHEDRDLHDSDHHESQSSSSSSLLSNIHAYVFLRRHETREQSFPIAAVLLLLKLEPGQQDTFCTSPQALEQAV